MARYSAIGGVNRSEQHRSQSREGLSLVELLIVLAIIGLLSGLTIPLMFRMGVFSGNRVEYATRELFSAIRAAKIYAATHSVDTGLAYAGLVGVDETQDSYSGQNHPVVDAYATVRRLKREELLAMSLPGDAEIYTVVGAEEGQFTTLSRQTCLLPDLFQVQPSAGGSLISAKGLRTIGIVQNTNFAECIPPRLPYLVDVPSTPNGWPEFRPFCPNIHPFPAHIFKPSGELRVPSNADGIPQRLTIRVGLLPNEDVSDRFTVDPDTVPSSPQFNQASLKNPVPIQFATDSPQLYTLISHPDPSLSETDFVDNDRKITLFRSQGRIKIEP